MTSRLVVFLLILPLVLAACRNPDVREHSTLQSPDTAVVDDLLTDPAELDAERGVAQQAGELEARRTMLQDPMVREAQVLQVQDTVRVTAVLVDQAVGDAELKARQFVIAAYRHLERPGTTEGTDGLGPSRYTYTVTLRDPAGETVFSGIKERQASEIREGEVFDR
jgi:hypothetical protein